VILLFMKAQPAQKWLTQTKPPHIHAILNATI